MEEIEIKEKPTLHKLCVEGKIEEVTALIKSGVDVNLLEDDELKFTPLHSVIFECDLSTDKTVAMVELLIKLGANPSLQDRDGDTPLHIAVGKANKDDESSHHIIKILFKQMSYPLLADNFGDSPLNQVVNDNNPLLAAFLTPDTEIKNLYTKIQLMEDYGISLKKGDKNANDKGVVACKLAKDLKTELGKFVINIEEKKPAGKPSNEEIKQFTENFVKLLHSKDDVMKKHRVAWKPIVANILLAFTVIGLIALAIKAGVAIIKKKDLLNDGMFFGKTKSQQKAGEVEEAVKSISPHTK